MIRQKWYVGAWRTETMWRLLDPWRSIILRSWGIFRYEKGVFTLIGTCQRYV